MLIINANIITMENKNYTNGYIKIVEDKIAELDSMEEFQRRYELKNIRNSEEVFDFDGKTILPGFVDGHSHIGVWENGMGIEGDDGNEETDPVMPQLRSLDAINPMDYCFEEARSAGVTTVVTGPGSANPIGGSFVALKTFGRRIDDMLVKSPVGMKFSLGENPKATYGGKSQTPATRMAIASLIRENLEKAQRYMLDIERAENDENLDEPEYDIKYEALIPVLKREIKAFFHAHRADDIFTAIRISKEYNLDYIIVHCTEGHKIADILASEQVGVITGPVISDRGKPELLSHTPQNAPILNSCGVKTAICTDHPEFPVQYLLLSAMIANSEGLSEEDALKAITIHPAELCGIDGVVGSLKVGKSADLVVFEKNPLYSYIKPFKIMIDGKWM